MSENVQTRSFLDICYHFRDRVTCRVLFTGSKFFIGLCITPALIAAFSTDDPSTPAIVPFLIFVGGYGLEIGWFVLLFFAVRIIVRSFKKKNRPSKRGKLDDMWMR